MFMENVGKIEYHTMDPMGMGMSQNISKLKTPKNWKSPS